MRATRLVQTWVTVRDGDGRTHLEARWIEEPVGGHAAQPAHAA